MRKGHADGGSDSTARERGREPTDGGSADGIRVVIARRQEDDNLAISKSRLMPDIAAADVLDRDKRKIKVIVPIRSEDSKI